jgi:hypothetical protein
MDIDCAHFTSVIALSQTEYAQASSVFLIIAGDNSPPERMQYFNKGSTLNLGIEVSDAIDA